MRRHRLARRLEARVLSAYAFRQESLKLWVITEADRSATTILLARNVPGDRR